jgi:hypothetical protein
MSDKSDKSNSQPTKETPKKIIIPEQPRMTRKSDDKLKNLEKK